MTMMWKIASRPRDIQIRVFIVSLCFRAPNVKKVLFYMVQLKKKMPLPLMRESYFIMLAAVTPLSKMGSKREEPGFHFQSK